MVLLQYMSFAKDSYKEILSYKKQIKEFINSRINKKKSIGFSVGILWIATLIDRMELKLIYLRLIWTPDINVGAIFSNTLE